MFQIYYYSGKKKSLYADNFIASQHNQSYVVTEYSITDDCSPFLVALYYQS